jgi:hypothetical protein
LSLLPSHRFTWVSHAMIKKIAWFHKNHIGNCGIIIFYDQLINLTADFIITALTYMMLAKKNIFFCK